MTGQVAVVDTVEKVALVPHPGYPPRGISDVSVRIVVAADHLWLQYVVRHDGALQLPDHPDGRHDNLWRRTCFELFAGRAGSPGYVEYNFAPYAAWAAYAFDDRRRGRRDAAIVDLHLVDGRWEDRAAEIERRYEYCVVVIREGPLAEPDARIGLTAVIEERSGTKSYWALAHPEGPPDFHDPACFILTLPAADAA